MADRASSSTKPSASSSLLNGGERTGAIVAAAAFLALAVWLLIAPPKVEKFAPQCASKDCVASVSNVPDGVVLALTGIGALLVVMSVGGIRFSKFSVPGITAETAVEQAAKDLKMLTPDTISDPEGGSAATGNNQPAPEEPPAGAPAEARPTPIGTVSVGGQPVSVIAPEAVPSKVLTDLFSAKAPSGRSASDVTYAARAEGQGNHPWLVKLNGDDQLWKVSYGGQGKQEATVVPLDT